ncbi:MAG: hypothetical protein C4555_01120 [Dehalococcoidia bacterium]|nr:MAG: hypothetical protein C4555_01120 [Dehalococcoidia bacterium]
MDKSDIVTRCIDEILEGKASLEDCVRRYPGLADEMRDLLAVAESIHQQRPVISPQFKSYARSRIFAGDSPAPLPRERQGVIGWLNPLTLTNGIRVPVAVLLAVFAVAGSGVTIAYASQSSLPGEVLYPVKISSENVRLAFTVTPESKAKLNLELAGRRVEEAVTQSVRGQDVSGTTAQAVARHLDAVIKEIESLDNEEKSKSLISQLSVSTINQQATLSQLIAETPESKHAALEETIDASRRGSTVAVVADANPSFLESAPSVADIRLEETYFKLEGVLQSAGDDWNLGGITVKSVNLPKAARYSVGSRMAVEGIIRNGRAFISSVKSKEDKGNEVKIEGVFGGADPDGVWYISGIAIGRPQGTGQASGGTKVKLTGLVQNGVFVVTRLEAGDTPRDVKITGKLIEVSRNGDTIVIEVAGARLTTSIEKAEVTTDSGVKLDKSDLRALTGQEIVISGLKSKEGILYAGKIYVGDESLASLSGASRSGDSGEKEAGTKSGDDERKRD